MIAGVTAQTVVYPLDLFRRRLQVNGTSDARHIFAGVWKLVRTGNVRSLYAGYLPSLVKVIPAAITSNNVRDKMLDFV